LTERISAGACSQQPVNGYSKGLHWGAALGCTAMLAGACKTSPRPPAPAPIDAVPPHATAAAPSGAPSALPIETRDGADPRRPTDALPEYWVDDSGIVVRGRRLDAAASSNESILRQLVSSGLMADRPASVRALRVARFDLVSALSRVLGQSGVKEVDIETPGVGAARANGVLSISPLGQVPMHGERCGSVITIRADGTAELKYMKQSQPTRLQQTAGPDMATALETLRARMADCSSTVWMIAGNANAVWGPAFDVGRAVSSLTMIPGTTRYIMLL
jgi:hypothetical protein